MASEQGKNCVMMVMMLVEMGVIRLAWLRLGMNVLVVVPHQ